MNAVMSVATALNESLNDNCGTSRSDMCIRSLLKADKVKQMKQVKYMNIITGQWTDFDVLGTSPQTLQFINLHYSEADGEVSELVSCENKSDRSSKGSYSMLNHEQKTQFNKL